MGGKNVCPTGSKRRLESRRGTHDCVRHVRIKPSSTVTVCVAVLHPDQLRHGRRTWYTADVFGMTPLLERILYGLLVGQAGTTGTTGRGGGRGTHPGLAQ